MDAISYSYADKQAKRIKKFNENPDSTSGILTQPSVIQTGETVSIPAGRTAIMANTVIDGTINLDGTMFIPSGASTDDIDAQLALKAPLESPLFTGSPMAPTQVDTDNSDKVVTTAWSKLGLSHSLGSNGYIKFPNWLSGITIQWGTTSLVSVSNIVVTTPISFASASYTTYATARTGSSFGNILSTDAGSLSQFTIYANATITATVAWLRIGK